MGFLVILAVPAIGPGKDGSAPTAGVMAAAMKEAVPGLEAAYPAVSAMNSMSRPRPRAERFPNLGLEPPVGPQSWQLTLFAEQRVTDAVRSRVVRRTRRTTLERGPKVDGQA